MNKKLFVIICLASGFILYSQESITKNIDSILVCKNSSYYDVMLTIENGWLVPLKNELFYLSLGNLDKNQLRLLRNTIYVQYGLIFQSNDLIHHFSKYPWYEPKKNDVESELSLTDKKNIKNIISFENPEKNTRIKNTDIIGHWEVGFPVSSGSYYPLFINKDGTFNLGYNSNGTQSLVSTRGRWNLANGYLVLVVEVETINLGGFFVEPFASYGGSYVYENSILADAKLEKPITYIIPISNVINDIIANNNVEKIFIGGW